MSRLSSRSRVRCAAAARSSSANCSNILLRTGGGPRLSVADEEEEEGRESRGGSRRSRVLPPNDSNAAARGFTTSGSRRGGRVGLPAAAVEVEGVDTSASAWFPASEEGDLTINSWSLDVAVSAGSDDASAREVTPTPPRCLSCRRGRSPVGGVGADDEGDGPSPRESPYPPRDGPPPLLPYRLEPVPPEPPPLPRQLPPPPESRSRLSSR